MRARKRMRSGTLHDTRGAFQRYVDTLIQIFEDRRSGLGDSSLEAGQRVCELFFLEIYERESERLELLLREQEPHLASSALASLRDEMDGLLRNVVIPAYVRLAVRFTPRERNDFYILGEGYRLVERLLFAVGGILLGTAVIVAPFIPLWHKEWILPFMIAGLLFPTLRGYLAIRRYEHDLNRLVGSAGRELMRLEASYLTYGESIGEIAALDRPSGDTQRGREQ